MVWVANLIGLRTIEAATNSTLVTVDATCGRAATATDLLRTFTIGNLVQCV